MCGFFGIGKGCVVCGVGGDPEVGWAGLSVSRVTTLMGVENGPRISCG